MFLSLCGPLCFQRYLDISLPLLSRTLRKKSISRLLWDNWGPPGLSNSSVSRGWRAHPLVLWHPQTRCRAGLVSHCRLRLSEQPRPQQGIQRTLFSIQDNTSSWVPELRLQCAWDSLCPLFLLLRFTAVSVVVPVQVSRHGALTQIPITQQGVSSHALRAVAKVLPLKN